MARTHSSLKSSSEEARTLQSLEEALAPDERDSLLRLSRETLDQSTSGGSLPEIPKADRTSGLFLTNKCFVTLRSGESLRGCIGSMAESIPLYSRVVESTVCAASEDPRFTAVTAKELESIWISLSILTKARPLPYESIQELLDNLVPMRHGVILTVGFRSALYLPQVWKMVPDKERFLSELARKAGLAENAWRGGQCTVSVFEAMYLSER